jgi:hypothetical protein
MTVAPVATHRAPETCPGPAVCAVAHRTPQRAQPESPSRRRDKQRDRGPAARPLTGDLLATPQLHLTFPDDDHHRPVCEGRRSASQPGLLPIRAPCGAGSPPLGPASLDSLAVVPDGHPGVLRPGLSRCRPSRFSASSAEGSCCDVPPSTPRSSGLIARRQRRLPRGPRARRITRLAALSLGEQRRHRWRGRRRQPVEKKPRTRVGIGARRLAPGPTGRASALMMSSSVASRPPRASPRAWVTAFMPSAKS